MIPFTQYMRPDGHREYIEAPIPDGWTQDEIDKLISLGAVFSCELLMTNQVVLYAGDSREHNEGDFAAEFCNNDDSVNDALKRLLRRTAAHYGITKEESS